MSDNIASIRAIVHRWFDQVLGTCDPLNTALVHNEHRALCDALDRMTTNPSGAGVIRALRDLADDLETASHASQSRGEQQGLLTAARFARAKAHAMTRESS